MRISDWSSDVCSSDLNGDLVFGNLGYLQGTLAVSVPIIKDVLAIRVAGNYNHRRGYTKVIGTSQRLDERNNDSQRLSVLVQPTAWLKNTTIYDRFHADQADRKSTRLNSITNAHIVCRLLLAKKNKTQP